MQLTENKIFLAIFAGIILFGLLIYATEYMKETTPKTTSMPAGTSSSTTTTTSETTTTAASSSSSTTTSSSTSTTTTTTTTTTSSTTTTLNYYWSKYAGKGYRQMFVEIKFTCPSCVPPTARALSLQEGMIMQNIGFRQNVSWVIYDPNRTTQYDIMRVIRSEGDASVLNDIPIP